MPGVYLSGTDHFLSLSASLHEAQVDLELRVLEFTLRSALQIARKRIVHASNDFLYVSRRLRAGVSFKSW